jgi:hypothetical protein
MASLARQRPPSPAVVAAAAVGGGWNDFFAKNIECKGK